MAFNYTVSLSSGAISQMGTLKARMERIWQSSSVEMGLEGRWSELRVLLTSCLEEMFCELEDFETGV